MSINKTDRSQNFKRAIDLGKVDLASINDLVRIWRTENGDEKAITLLDFVQSVNEEIIGGDQSLTDLIESIQANYVPYVGATTDVDLNAFNIIANAIIKNGGLGTQFLKADGTVDNNNYLTANDLPSTLSLYATNVPSDVAGYFKLVTTIEDVDYNTTPVDIPTGAITTTNQLIASLVSPFNLINGNPGVFNVTTIGNIRKVSGTGNAEFYFEIYKREFDGTETLVGTSGNTIPVVNSGYAEFFATAIWNDGIFGVTDTIVLKFYGSRIAGGSNPTYQFQFGGEQPVRTIVPIPTAVIPNIFLGDLADVEDGVALDNQGIFWDTANSVWKYKSIAEALGYTPISLNSPLTGFSVGGDVPITDSNTVLTAFEQVQAQLNGKTTITEVKEITGYRIDLNTQGKDDLVQAINESNTWTVIEW